MPIGARMANIFLVLHLSALAATGAEPVEEFTLPNGLTVILKPSARATVVAMVTLYRRGGGHDPLGKSGRAHLLEHLYVTSAAGKLPARKVDDYVRAYPDGWNAQTSFDATVLVQVFKPPRLAGELADAAARMSRLTITQSDLDREVPRVLDELENMYERVPMLMGINHARRSLHPLALGGQYGGNPEQVRSLTVEELTQTWKDDYRPNQAILVLAGNFEAPKARKEIEDSFGAIVSGKIPPELPPRPERGADSSLKVKPKSIAPGSEGVVCLAFSAPQPNSKDYPAFLILVSRLFAKAGPQPGRVAPVYFPMLDDPSTIALQASLARNTEADPVLRELEQRLADALKPDVTSAEKTRAVDSAALLGTVEIPVENNPYGVAFSLARCRQLGIDGKTLKSQIEKVTSDDLKALAAGAFDRNRRVVVVVEAP